jgi:hypothetical protein
MELASRGILEGDPKTRFFPEVQAGRLRRGPRLALLGAPEALCSVVSPYLLGVEISPPASERG